MKLHWKQATLLLLPGALAAGCIPNRDNPNDPSIAPRPALAVTDRGPLLNGCTASPAQVAVASRGDCLALDARVSSSPESGALSFQFFYLGTNLSASAATATPSPVPASAGTAGLAVFTRAELLRLPVGPPLQFEVRVSQGRDLRSTTATVVLTDAPPVASAMPPSILPLGGFGWAPGQAMPVTLDGSGSYDPDGDALTYQWAITGLPLVTTTSAITTVAIPANVTTRYAIELTVFDAPPGGPARSQASDTSFSWVRVGTPPVWAEAPPEGGLAIDDLYELVDTEFAPVPISGTPLSAVAAVDSAGSPIVLVTSTLVPGHGPDIPFIGVQDGISAAALYSEGNPDLVETSFAADLPRRRLWSISELQSGAEQITLQQFAAGNFLNAGSPFTPQFSSLALPPQVDSSGTLWLAVLTSTGAPQIQAYGSSSAQPLLVDSVDPSYQATAFSIRQRTNQAWVLESPTPAGTGNAFAPRISIHTVGSAPTYVTLDASGYGHGLSFLPASQSADQLWLELDQRGLLRVDAARLLADGLSPVSIELTVPGVTTACTPMDPAIGDCWVSSDSGTSRITPDGTVATFPVTTAQARLFNFTPDGDLWFMEGGSLFRGMTPDPSGVALSIHVSPGDAAIDPTTGGLWVSGSTLASLEKVAVDGQVFASFIEIQDGGGVDSRLPELFPWRPSPGGGFAFASSLSFNGSNYQEASTIELNLGTTPFTELPVFGTNTSQSIDAQVMESSVPLPASTPFAWIATGIEASAPVIELVSPSGFTQVAFDTPGQQGFSLLGARSTRTNQLCAETAQLSNATTVQLDGWLVDPATPVAAPGHIVTLTTSYQSSSIVASPGAYLGGVASAPETLGGAVDLCWLGMNHPNLPNTIPPPPVICPTGDAYLFAYPTAGLPGTAPSVFRTITLPGSVIESIAPIDGNHLWVTASSCNAGNTAVVFSRVRLDFEGSGFTATTFPSARRELVLSPEQSHF